MVNYTVFTYRVLKALEKPTSQKPMLVLDRSALDSILSDGMDKLSKSKGC